MDDLLKPLINLIPAKWHTTVAMIAVLIPYAGRAWYALRNGGGLVGVWHSLIYGTNIPKATPQVVLTAPSGGSNVAPTTTSTTTN